MVLWELSHIQMNGEILKALQNWHTGGNFNLALAFMVVDGILILITIWDEYIFKQYLINCFKYFSVLNIYILLYTYNYDQFQKRIFSNDIQATCNKNYIFTNGDMK